MLQRESSNEVMFTTRTGGICINVHIFNVFVSTHFMYIRELPFQFSSKA